MYDAMFDGVDTVEGIVALLHTAAIQATEMRHRLMSIEDILGDEYDLDRLRELAQADRDGKLPKYTIGDIIYDRFGMAWTVDSLEYVQCTYEKKWLYRCGYPGTDDYRGLYQDEVLTRAEAEAALRREQE